MAESQYLKYDNEFMMHYRENAKYYALTDQYHNDFEIIYVVNGKIEITISDKVYLVGPETLVLVNNLEPHQITIVEYPYCRYVLMFKPSYLSMFSNEPVLASVFNYRPKNFNHLVQLTADQSPSVRAIFDEILEEYSQSKPFWERSIKMLLSKLIIYLYRIAESSFPLSSINNKTNKKIIVDVQKYIDKHYMEELNLKDIAEMFHTNMYYLSHLFKDITGSTFKNYLIQHRISYAKDLLSYTSKDITEVGAESGFKSVNHFINMFKKNVSISPYKYRKNFLNNPLSGEPEKEREAD